MEADEINLNACLYIAKMEENILLSPFKKDLNMVKMVQKN